MIRPKVLAVHFTSNCNLKCSICYRRKVEGKPFKWFLGIPGAAAEIGVEQIALGGGEPLLYPAFLKEFAKRCADQHLILNMTTNGTMDPVELLEDDLTRFTMISVSVDAYKCGEPGEIERRTELMDSMRARGVKVGCNLLLNNAIAQNIIDFVKSMRGHADSVYLLQPKFSHERIRLPSKYTVKALDIALGGVYVDQSIQLEWGLAKSCGRGRDLLAVHPDGTVGHCSFDEPVLKLDEPKDLVKFAHEGCEPEGLLKCPFVA